MTGDDDDMPKVSCEAKEVDGRSCVCISIAFATGDLAEMVQMGPAAFMDKESGSDYKFADLLAGLEAKVQASMTSTQMKDATGADLLSRLAFNISLGGSLDRSGLMIMNAMLKSAADECPWMEDEYKMPAKALKVISSVAEFTQRVKFHGFEDLLSSIAKEGVEMVKGVNVSDLFHDMLASELGEMLEGDDAPESLGQSYEQIQSQCEAVRKIEVWAAGAYLEVDIVGLSPDFLPSKQACKDAQE